MALQITDLVAEPAIRPLPTGLGEYVARHEIAGFDLPPDTAAWVEDALVESDDYHWGPVAEA